MPRLRGDLCAAHAKNGGLNPSELKVAVQKDHEDTGEPLMDNLSAVKLSAEKLNAMRKGALQ